jgi:Zn-dependent membrane protease YugP
MEDVCWKCPLYTYQNKENHMNTNLLTTIFKAVALGMGVAVIVLNVLGTLTVETAVSMLGIGLTALALAGLQKE